MEQPARNHSDDAADGRTGHRIFVTVGLILAVLIVVAALMYAVAFIVLAPMMQ